jgi:hypothetical protein
VGFLVKDTGTYQMISRSGFRPEPSSFAITTPATNPPMWAQKATPPTSGSPIVIKPLNSCKINHSLRTAIAGSLFHFHTDLIDHIENIIAYGLIL